MKRRSLYAIKAPLVTLAIITITININIANVTTRVTITHNNITRVVFVSSSIGIVSYYPE